MLAAGEPLSAHPAQAGPATARPVSGSSTRAQDAEPTPTGRSLRIWVPSGSFEASSLIKVPRFTNVAKPMAPRTLHLTSVRNGEVSAQLAVGSAVALTDLTATVSALNASAGHRIPASASEVRYVGYVPVDRGKPRGGGATAAQVDSDAVSGRGGKWVVADPLWPWQRANVPAHTTQPIWFTIHVPATAAVGTYRGDIRVAVAGRTVADYSLDLTVQKPILPDPGRGNFGLDVWFNPDALASAYHVTPWSAAHWRLIQRYFDFLARAGQRTILAAIVQHPWRVAWNHRKPQTATGYDSLVGWSFDGQHWAFDYHRFDRYVQAALQAGLGPKIVAYSMLSFRGPQRLSYLDTRTGTARTRIVHVGSRTWDKAWCAFARSFARHLKIRGWLDDTWLGFDERPAALIKPTLALLHRCAPEFLERTQMAGTAAISQYAVDLSLGWSSLESVSDRWIEHRRRHGRITTFYTWAGDVHPNTLSFSPAVESRMMGWIGVKRHLDGYLHWAFDDWPPDVFRDPAYGYSQGDEYFVYPGPHGPVSSIRWELLKAGIADAELVQMAERREPHSRELAAALHLATRDPDGNTKDVHDITRAHAMVVDVLDRAR